MSRTLHPFLLIVLALTAAGAGGEEREPSKQAFQEYAEARQGRSAYGLYLAGHKLGWGVTEWVLGEHEGRKVLIENAEIEIKLQLLGETETMRSASRSFYELEGEGALIFVEEETEDNEEVTTHTMVRRDGEHVIKTVVGGHESSRTVPLSKQTLAQDKRFHEWITQSAVEQDKMLLFTVDLEQPEDIDLKEEYTFLERRETRWGGVPVLSARVQLEASGVLGEVEILSDGTMVSGMMGPFELRLEEERVARDYDAPMLDMLLEVPVDRDLGNPAMLDSLTLECIGVAEFEFPVLRRQTVRTKESGTAVLDLRRDFRTGKVTNLNESEQKRFLQATPFVQADHPEVVELANRIVGDEKDVVTAVDRLQTWVFTNLDPSYKDNAVHALQVLDNMAGDCTEHSMLFVALARAAGIPARTVAGLAYAASERPFFAWHEWAEIHDGSQWITVDPTWGQVFVDATHIRTWTEQIVDDYSSIELMFGEGMSCEVLEMGTAETTADPRDPGGAPPSRGESEATQGP